MAASVKVIIGGGLALNCQVMETVAAAKEWLAVVGMHPVVSSVPQSCSLQLSLAGASRSLCKASPSVGLSPSLSPAPSLDLLLLHAAAGPVHPALPGGGAPA
jgi:hypothetical protein